jgi:predicted  nucleic acid-binding Zn-ribbon protein
MNERAGILGATRLVDGVRDRFDDEPDTECPRVGCPTCGDKMFVPHEERRRKRSEHSLCRAAPGGVLLGDRDQLARKGNVDPAHDSVREESSCARSFSSRLLR